MDQPWGRGRPWVVGRGSLQGAPLPPGSSGRASLQEAGQASGLRPASARPPSPPQATTRPPSVSAALPALDAPWRRTHTIRGHCGFLHGSRCSQGSSTLSSEAELCSFLWLSNIPPRGCNYMLSTSIRGGTRGFFPFLTLLSKVAVHIPIHVLCGHRFLILWACTRSGTLAHTVTPRLTS